MVKTPNPDAFICIEVTEDNEDRICDCCGAVPLQQGYVAGFEYYCTIECMRKDAEANELADVLEWLAKHDSGIEMTEEDLEYIYYTEWDEE